MVYMSDSNSISDISNNMDEMRVVKRDGNFEIVSFDKILRRVKNLGQQFNLKIPYTQLVMKVIDQLYNNIKTCEIDELTAQQCASMSSINTDYNKLAGAIVISNLQKNTLNNFCETMKKLHNFIDINGKHCSLIDNNLMNIIENNKEFLESFIDYSRDFEIDYFGFKTLERAYLFKINNKIVERPQHMWLRVSIGIHGSDIDKVKETYNLMSQKYFTHATPTLFNAGTPRPQLSSCFLLSMESDSIDGIFNTLKECAQISKWSGGIGLHVHNIRCTGSHIRGTNGISNGLIPMLGVFNKTARYVDQGGKRNGSFAIYLEPHHPDIEDFLDLKKNHGDEEKRSRDLFYALWISDLFMKRVKDNKDWCLFCPDQCPELCERYGDEYENIYLKYESEHKYIKKIKARELWIKILDAQMETGTPYLLYKDACNKKSNQKNLGTIKSSNLCTEIIEYSDSNETAVCNLASISLPRFVKSDKSFDYEKLVYVTGVLVNNLNNIIDINFYPNDKTRRSNLLHRPIGIGVQGLADTFIMMDLAFTSDEAKKINKQIFETIYYGALLKSCEISKNRYMDMKYLLEEYEHGNWSFLSDEISCREYDILNVTNASSSNAELENKKVERLLSIYKPIRGEIEKLKNNKEYIGSYSSFVGSPTSKGILQFDMWNVTPSDRYDWNELRNNIQKYGLRNSLLCAPMPTASTAQILGNNECFEPLTSNIYSRRTLAGDFVIVNKYLVNDLMELGMWNESIKNNIIANNGSIQYIDGLPQNIKEKYKIVWEMPMRDIIDMSRDRGAYICQSQSLNLWVEDPDPKILTNIHFYSWNAGLKTGIYYLRRKPKHQPQQFTIEPEKQKLDTNNEDTDCLMCSG